MTLYTKALKQSTWRSRVQWGLPGLLGGEGQSSCSVGRRFPLWRWSLVCFSSWGHRELAMTERLNTQTHTMWLGTPLLLPPLGKTESLILETRCRTWCPQLIGLCTHARLLSHGWLFAPLSVGFPRQEYWSGLPFSPPADLPDPELELESPALQVDSLPLSHLASLTILYHALKVCWGQVLCLVLLSQTHTKGLRAL